MTIKTISPQDLYRRIKLGHNVALFDVRSQDEYEEGHIMGASLYPLKSFNNDMANILQKIHLSYSVPPTIYVICASGSEAGEACQYLADTGYEYIIKLEGGMHAWITAGLPVIRRKIKEKPPLLPSLHITQQIQIAVGLVVTIGTLLGTFVNTGFLAISFLAGVGFTYEGLFGTDYLKQALLKMFWNKGHNV